MNTKKIAIIGVLIALCVVGSLINVPSAAGTVAFDSMPGYVAAGLFGPLVGGVVGSIGHLINAGMKGFPLSFASHFFIALFMFLAMVAYGYFYKKSKGVAVIVATIINGPLSLVPFAFIISPAFAISMVFPLTFASLINILLALLITPRLERIVNE